jgi:hypothetical protein
MTTIRRSGRTRFAWFRLGALAAGMSLLMSSCFTLVAEDHRAKRPETRPWYCNAVGDGTPPGGHGNGSHVHPIYEGMTKGPLSWDDCIKLGNQLDKVLASVWGMWTRRQGEAAGWREIAHYIPGLGTHHTKGFFPGVGPGGPGGPGGPPGSGSTSTTGPTSSTSSTTQVPATFDPAKPQFLIYGGTSPDAPLMGVAYAARGGSNPPEAFAGDNDWWHLHRKICILQGEEGFEILAGAEEIPDEECTALGGRQINLGSGIWLLHVWMVPRYMLKFDVFVSGHPCLGETGPLPWEDPCWEEMAQHDPADGPLPGGHDGGGHDPHDGTSSTVGTTTPPDGTSSTVGTTTPPDGTSSTVGTTTPPDDHGHHGEH